MLNPDLNKLTKGEINRFSLVTGTAKLARDIADRAEEEKEIIEEKTVTLAMMDLLDEKYRIVEPAELQKSE